MSFLENYSYVFGIIPELSLSFWNLVYFVIFVTIINFIISARIVTLSNTVFFKTSIALILSFGILIIFGFVGWLVHLALSVITYAIVSEFAKDY